jgi:hypothetical protein
MKAFSIRLFVPFIMASLVAANSSANTAATQTLGNGVQLLNVTDKAGKLICTVKVYPNGTQTVFVPTGNATLSGGMVTIKPDCVAALKRLDKKKASTDVADIVEADVTQ